MLLLACAEEEDAASEEELETITLELRKARGERWDCESVLSTLSNVDNLPTGTFDLHV